MDHKWARHDGPDFTCWRAIVPGASCVVAFDHKYPDGKYTASIKRLDEIVSYLPASFDTLKEAQEAVLLAAKAN
jgi:hypothetical protein